MNKIFNNKIAKIYSGSGLWHKRPSKLFSELTLPENVKYFSGGKYDLKICDGLKLELIHAPGTHDEHSIVWWSNKDIAFTGRLIYQVS